MLCVCRVRCETHLQYAARVIEFFPCLPVSLSLSQNEMSVSPPLSSCSHPPPSLSRSLPLTLSLSPSLATRVHIVFSFALSHPEKSLYCQIAGTPTKSWLSRGVDWVNLAVFNVLLAQENLQNLPAFMHVIMNLYQYWSNS